MYQIFPNRFDATPAPRRARFGNLFSGLAVAVLLGVAGFLHADVIDNLPLEVRTSVTAQTAQIIAYSQPNNETGYYESAFEYGAQATLQPGSPSVLRNVTLPYYFTPMTGPSLDPESTPLPGRGPS